MPSPRLRAHRRRDAIDMSPEDELAARIADPAAFAAFDADQGRLHGWAIRAAVDRLDPSRARHFLNLARLVRRSTDR